LPTSNEGPISNLKSPHTQPLRIINYVGHVKPLSQDHAAQNATLG